MTDDERVEAVSREIWSLNPLISDLFPMPVSFLSVGRAAILATLQSLREPSDAMIEAAMSPGYARTTWERMIDQAIHEAAP